MGQVPQVLADLEFNRRGSTTSPTGIANVVEYDSPTDRPRLHDRILQMSKSLARPIMWARLKRSICMEVQHMEDSKDGFKSVKPWRELNEENCPLKSSSETEWKPQIEAFVEGSLAPLKIHVLLAQAAKIYLPFLNGVGVAVGKDSFRQTCVKRCPMTNGWAKHWSISMLAGVSSMLCFAN